MNVVDESVKLYREAWSDHSKFTELLEEAAHLLKDAIDSGEDDPLLLSNYSAVLLDLQRDTEALDILKQRTPMFSEYCSNYAIAIAKTAYNLALIRRWNQAAAKQPKRQGAIVAYMDWQAL
ncbi:hypothetical protein [Agarilytica rhodophyticola]|uniref:hypothetical protein n=1 Tax=Agarilytica rhodophyticola TaxID=1737490 RepID=UPI000B341856|nr:hypothetical protein [Agarilytica rhodophyticola]